MCIFIYVLESTLQAHFQNEKWKPHVKYRESYKPSKSISYSHTIIGKTVGKVTTFDVFFASLPTPLIQCRAKLNAFCRKL